MVVSAPDGVVSSPAVDFVCSVVAIEGVVVTFAAALLLSEPAPSIKTAGAATTASRLLVRLPPTSLPACDWLLGKSEEGGLACAIAENRSVLLRPPAITITYQTPYVK